MPAPHLDLVHPIWTIFGMDILLDPRNKPTEEICILLKIQDGRWRSKIEFQHNFGSKITFRLGKWIPLIRFGQNLAGRYYSTIETSLSKNFSFFSKSKLASGGQKSHFGLANGSPLSDLDKIWQEHTI